MEREGMGGEEKEGKRVRERERGRGSGGQGRRSNAADASQVAFTPPRFAVLLWLLYGVCAVFEFV